MNKLFVQCAAAACIAAMAAATSAEAGSRRSAVAAGVIGGLAAGAIIGSAIANSNGYTYDGYGTYYAPPVAYYGPGSPGCYWHWQRVWDGYMWRNQRVYMCY